MINKSGSSWQETLLLVNKDDSIISTIGKKEAHLKSSFNLYPHRAFSVFLFNERSDLLIQQRSHKKVTFPGLWSNTCCSHPLNIAQEKREAHHEGIKRSAVRRMQFEIGIDSCINDYTVYEKILYRSDSDEIFEEFELDSILLIKKNLPLLEAKKTINRDEISDLKYVSKEELLEASRTHKTLFTPWFHLIIQHKIDELFMAVSNLSSDYENQKIKITPYL